MYRVSLDSEEVDAHASADESLNLALGALVALMQTDAVNH
jgi:hypothetical protein